MATKEMSPAPEAPADVHASPTRGPSFEIVRPDRWSAAVIHASPHSGRIYPPDLMRLAALDGAAIRSSEDAYVDELVGAAPQCGAPLIKALFARAYVDVNRGAFELDPGMFSGELPFLTKARTARVAAGLGTIARVVGEGREIYHSKVPVAEAMERIEDVHRPYHEALTVLINEGLARFGEVALLDWHSMPSSAAGGFGGRGGPDVILGDRFGAACGPALVRAVEHEFQKRGYRVVRNAPYAGGYTTEHYGRPAVGVQALQVELNRALYLDEARVARSAGFDALRQDLSEIIAALPSRVVGERRRIPSSSAAAAPPDARL